MSVVSLSNPIFASYVFYATLCTLKMLIMSFLTARVRIGSKIFAAPEDGAMYGIKPRRDESVERIRRAHRNDLENIIPFLILGFFYTLTSPAYATALLCFRVFTIARFIHTFVYAIVVIPQPARALAFFAGMAVNGYLGYQIILATY